LPEKRQKARPDPFFLCGNLGKAAWWCVFFLCECVARAYRIARADLEIDLKRVVWMVGCGSDGLGVTDKRRIERRIKG
jgi:hypothetical protein